jgi:dTDP-4-amino-4,6-dideoxygalactose transaminase
MIGDEERDAVAEVLLSPQLVHGPRIAAFETGFAAMLGPGAHATSVSSCTAGLHLIYFHLGLGPGDEVIVPAETHVATAHAVEVTGARPVFVDCDASGNIDVSQIPAAITERTRAICVVHYPGLPVDVTAVNALAHPLGIFVVEDCALAIGASLDGVACGLLGDAGSFSFYPVKHMTTGEGGMVVSRHSDVITSIASLKAFGYDRSPDARKVPGVYDIARLGINYRMNEIGAAIGLVQLDKLQDFDARRRANAHALRSALQTVGGLTLLPDGDERCTHANYCLVAVLDQGIDRDETLLQLKERGVGTSVYYPVPLPLSKYYIRKYGYTIDQFPNAQRISSSSIALPVGPHLTPEDMDTIAVTIADVLGG